MNRLFQTRAIALLFIIIGLVIPQGALAQDFPYLAPEAPEFDGRGNPVDRPYQRPSVTGKQSGRSASTGDQSTRTDVMPLQPDRTSSGFQLAPRTLSSPQAPIGSRESENPAKPGNYPSFPQIPRNNAPTPPPVAAYPPPGAPSQTPERSDCSEFPVLLATARSESEMQFTARRYLTCLMQNGWNMDQARQQVINIIESAARVGR